MRTRVFLTPSDNVLVGKYPQGADDVYVICDSTVAVFTVTLPDLFSPEHKEFIFYNMPEDGVGNDVTVACIAGQMINVNQFSHVLAPFDSATFVSDMKKRWLLSDINQ
jgi:hypothetical protein